MTDLDIYVKVEPFRVVESFAEELSSDEILTLIMHLDQMMADVEFTEKLIKKLKKSLKNDTRW